ncbi:alanine racemase region protein [Parvularcula bermudensis HTCC2503]|uniref:Alanine racemase n=1 Tax=Parvularcula bermudensis (strain ATCC BAA-594 / HTCC2503 / KCTC 12087) TaxID=314260 RepID=E0TB39_PARBH|nr:alanine racemase [Parvularcula bermudensis]ADM08248.1 alanine racemase region protein [Parvularcula bermudensis HTCC2503]
MSSPPASPTLTVDLGALGRNYDELKRRTGGTSAVAPVVKANAYGLGMHAIARTLYREKGARLFFTATCREALALLVDGQRFFDDAPPRVYVLNGFDGDRALQEKVGYLPILSDWQDVGDWVAGGGGPCGISVDIGMNRLGMSFQDAGGLPQDTRLNPDDVQLIMMHLSHSGDPTAPENELQAEKFFTSGMMLARLYPKAQFSLSNSGGILLGLAPEQQIVRAGYALYGGAPNGLPGQGLDQVTTFEASVLQVRDIGSGESVGYNGTWRAERPTRLAVLGAGYADGIQRALSNRGAVWLGGGLCPIRGAVSMDLVTVDITDAPSPVTRGDKAEIWGAQIDLDLVARQAGTIGYDLLTGVGSRVERIYRLAPQAPRPPAGSGGQ